MKIFVFGFLLWMMEGCIFDSKSDFGISNGMFAVQDTITPEHGEDRIIHNKVVEIKNGYFNIFICNTNLTNKSKSISYFSGLINSKDSITLNIKSFGTNQYDGNQTIDLNDSIIRPRGLTNDTILISLKKINEDEIILNQVNDFFLLTKISNLDSSRALRAFEEIFSTISRYSKLKTVKIVI